jgi:hypothetical protein
MRSLKTDAIISGITAGVVEALAAGALHRYAQFGLRTSILYAVPVTASISIALFLLLLKRLRDPKDTKNSKHQAAPTATLTQPPETALTAVLKDMGIVGCTSRLTDSKYEPTQCMQQARRKLWFMGILASKWVIEPRVRAEFRDFLSAVHYQGGEVRFLLINPKGRAFTRLRDQREGAISTESLKHIKALAKEFSCFQVRLYDLIPCFRLVFIDETMLAVSRYKIDKRGYFASKYGWEAPHLLIDGAAPWSLYDAFDLYFHQVWDSSQCL